MKYAPSAQSVILSILVLMVLALALVNAYQFLQPRGTLHCDSFGSYYDIPSDWETTSPQLDGNGDHIPCNDRQPSKSH